MDTDVLEHDLAPGTVDLARRIQAACAELEGRQVDDETAIRLARHINGEWD